MKLQQDKLRYPIGQFEYGKSYSLDDTRKHIKVLVRFPKDLKNVVKKLKSGDLDKTYRPEGWTIRQVVNHIADSHLHAYIRIKLAVTEPTPIIKPYEEQLWAELEDGKHGSIKTSIKLLTALHKRWTSFLKSIQEDDLEKGYYHPASKRTVSVQEAIALYVWHSHHHLGHINLVAEGKHQSVGGKKTSEEAKADTDNGLKSVAPAQAAKKRSITAEHREKIRAAQVARHAKNASSGAGETPATTAAPAAKRGRKPGVKVASVAAAPTAKRGRKPGVKAAATPLAATGVEKPKRGRKPGVKAAATAPLAAVEIQKPKRGRKPGIKAATASVSATEVEKPKRGRKPGIKAAAAQTDAPARRARRTKAQMEAARSGQAEVTQTTPAEKAETGKKASARIIVIPPKKRKTTDNGPIVETRIPRGTKKPAEAAAKPVKAAKAAKPAATTGDAPKRRGLSAERMAEIRALRGVKKTTEDTGAEPVKTAKAAKPVKAAKVAKPAATTGDAPKRRGLSPERMAEIRALRGAKKTTDNTSDAPKTVKAAKPAKAAKTVAAPTGDAPKRRGLSPERMAEIRAMKKKK